MLHQIHPGYLFLWGMCPSTRAVSLTGSCHLSHVCFPCLGGSGALGGEHSLPLSGPVLFQVQAVGRSFNLCPEVLCIQRCECWISKGLDFRPKRIVFRRWVGKLRLTCGSRPLNSSFSFKGARLPLFVRNVLNSILLTSF